MEILVCQALQQHFLSRLYCARGARPTATHFVLQKVSHPCDRVVQVLAKVSCCCWHSPPEYQHSWSWSPCRGSPAAGMGLYAKEVLDSAAMVPSEHTATFLVRTAIQQGHSSCHLQPQVASLCWQHVYIPDTGMEKLWANTVTDLLPASIFGKSSSSSSHRF